MKGAARVTLVMLAKELGLSAATISLALNGKGGQYGLKPETVARVEAAARRLGYLADESARSLRRGSTSVVAVIFPHLRNNWADRIVAGMQPVLEARGFSLILLNHGGDAERERRMMTSLLQRRIEGVICNPLEENAALYREVVRHGVPLVFLSDALAGVSGVGYSAWDPCEQDMALAYLAGKGCRRVGLLGVRDRRVVARGRMERFLRRLPAYGLVSSSWWRLRAGGDRDLPGLLRERLAAGRKLPDAFFAIYDDLAYLACDVLAEGGVGGHVRVVTLGDSPLSGPRGYNLTAVSAPVEDEGRVAAEILLDQLDSPGCPPRHVLVRGGQLVVRDGIRGNSAVPRYPPVA